MAYQKSMPVVSWLTERSVPIRRVAEAHAALGEVEGRGRPLQLGKPLAHAYIIRIVAEFQAFVRDLHDLAAEHLVNAARPPEGLFTLLTRAITRGRAIDAGNATMTALRTDFGRLGIRNLEGKLAARCSQWDTRAGGTDAARYNALVEVRNALAHGNQRQVSEHRRQGHMDTVSWGRQQLPVLNRTARALDQMVWDHLKEQTGATPW